MFDSQGGVEEVDSYAVCFSKQVWEKALAYFDKIPDSLVEKLHSKLKLSTKK